MARHRVDRVRPGFQGNGDLERVGRASGRPAPIAHKNVNFGLRIKPAARAGHVRGPRPGIAITGIQVETRRRRRTATIRPIRHGGDGCVARVVGGMNDETHYERPICNYDLAISSSSIQQGAMSLRVELRSIGVSEAGSGEFLANDCRALYGVLAEAVNRPGSAAGRVRGGPPRSTSSQAHSVSRGMW